MQQLREVLGLYCETSVNKVYSTLVVALVHYPKLDPICQNTGGGFNVILHSENLFLKKILKSSSSI